ncbi:MAG: DUF4911 domain-containing protein [Myxococcota bacterium]|nr:DUF4911 domain-containing protein [Myxococcota bacterium]
MTAPLHDGPGLVTRRLRVAKHEVAWLRYVVEAHGHLANVHVAKGGVVTLVAPVDRAALLDGVLADLEREITVERLGAPA